ncbi:TrmB family transcriptional regulator [Methanocella arvoryzae]|uniref:Transcription regulator (TrmB family) n=1 Tax=Methanocella arvoryzae (strain DSM 22066 / NBRC 105507 / MRE50) TaxID=351160 RepID=Q0W3Q3_METAR|nr:TrmB family transcriptional regulator [Methanocella arvoryzae]CAJ36990.1 transcription regulator (TrmB family) [Methanocella arvoryzae MRE50]
MVLDEKVLTTLQRMGMTYYGAKAYAVLVASGPSSPSAIAREAEVPRSKIYETLKRLEESGWVRVERSRPLTYKPVYPKEAIEERRKALNAEIEYASAELSSVYDRQVDQEAPNVKLIRGMDNIVPRIEDMISRARHDVCMLGALYTRDEIARVKKYLASARKRGVNVRIITRPTIATGEGGIATVEAFSMAGSDIRLFRTPFIKFVVIDGREIMIMFSRVEDDVPDARNAVAIWTPNPDISSYMLSNFNMMWDAADAPGK